MGTTGTILIALVIAVGLVGIVVPILPGGLLVLGAIMVWAVVTATTAAWVALAVAAVLIAAAEVIKYTWPVKRMRDADVRTPILWIGAACGIVGFFVVPVIGLLMGFVLGVFGAELVARRDAVRAWASTVHALKGVALSVGVELTGALLAAATWAVAVLAF